MTDRKDLINNSHNEENIKEKETESKVMVIWHFLLSSYKLYY